jgi:hypothetical protein
VELTQPFRLTHLSASSISDYLECPLGWHGRRVAKWPEPPSPPMAIGSALHAAFAAHHRERGDAELALLSAWSRYTDGLTLAPGAMQRAVNALRAYRAINPAESGDRPDFKLSWNVPGVPIPIIGFLDLMRSGVVHEQKTTSSSRWWNQKRADSALQGSAYWDGYTRLIGQPPRSVVYWIVNVAAPVPIQRLETVRSAEDIEKFQEQARDVYARILRGDLARGCAPGRCRFPEMCQQWEGA